MLFVLHVFMSQSGTLVANPVSLSASLSVPDSAPQLRVVAGGDGGHQPHSMGGLTRSFGVGAFECASSVPPPNVSSLHSVPYCVGARSDGVADSSGVLRDSHQLSLISPSLASSEMDQLRAVTSQSVVTAPSVILSPSSLLFPLPDSGFSSLPSSSSFAYSSFLFLRPMFPLPLFPRLLLSLILSLLLFLLLAPPLAPSFSTPSSSASPSFSHSLSLPLFSSSASVGFPSSSSFLPSLPFFSAASQSVPLFSSASTTLSSTPLPSLSSSFLASVSLVADYHAHVLGLSSEYQALARWFLASGGSDFFGFVSSSFLNLLWISRDFASCSSLFLASLRAPLPPSSFPPPPLGGSVLPPSVLVRPTFPPPVSHLLPRFSASSSPSVSSFSTLVSFHLAPSGFCFPSVAFLAPFPGYAIPSASSSSVPPVPRPPPPPGLAFLLSAPSASFFPSATGVPPPVSLSGPVVIPGLGVGIFPSTSGDHPFSAFAASAPSASASVPLGPGFTPVSPGFSSAPPPSTSFSAPSPASDPFSDSEDRLPDEDPLFVDPSVAPLASDAFRG